MDDDSASILPFNFRARVRGVRYELGGDDLQVFQVVNACYFFLVSIRRWDRHRFLTGVFFSQFARARDSNYANREYLQRLHAYSGFLPKDVLLRGCEVDLRVVLTRSQRGSHVSQVVEVFFFHRVRRVGLIFT